MVFTICALTTTALRTQEIEITVFLKDGHRFIVSRSYFMLLPIQDLFPISSQFQGKCPLFRAIGKASPVYILFAFILDKKGINGIWHIGRFGIKQFPLVNKRTSRGVRNRQSKTWILIAPSRKGIIEVILYIDKLNVWRPHHTGLYPIWFSFKCRTTVSPVQHIVGLQKRPKARSYAVAPSRLGAAGIAEFRFRILHDHAIRAQQ